MNAVRRNSVSVDVTASDIQARFPGWRVWRTRDKGTWYATRAGADWNKEPRTLAADSGTELLQELTGATASADCSQWPRETGHQPSGPES